MIAMMLFIAGLVCTGPVESAPGHLPATQASSKASNRLAALIDKAATNGSLPVIIRLNMGFQPEGHIPQAAIAAQQAAISHAQTAVLAALNGHGPSNIKRYQYVPFLAAAVNAAALRALAGNPNVLDVTEDIPVPPTLAQSTVVVNADAAWNAGYDGSGWTVAILDTGVDKNHHFLAGKVVSEACYSTTYAPQQSTSVCPGGASSSTATDSGLNCPVTTEGCEHGTHVAGIAAGHDYSGGPGYNGVARGANIIAIQIFSQFTGSNCTNIGYSSPCALSYVSDQISGLDRVYALRTSFNIASANMSLGGGNYTSNCDSQSQKPSIDNLRSVDIATVIASGNSGYTNAMGAPGCISSAISVGATCDSSNAGFGCAAVDDIPSYSNIASFISLLAPGSAISSSTPGTDTFQTWHGTSMATPHVTGAWAIMKQQSPSATVSDILADLQASGAVVDDNRAGGTVTGMKRIMIPVNTAGVLQPPTLLYPLGGESLRAGSAADVQWQDASNPAGTAYSLEFTDTCTALSTAFSDDMESGGSAWSATHGSGTVDWSLGSANPHAGNTSWFASDPATISDQYLETGPVTVPPNAELRFWHDYNTESTFDGGVVEISTDGLMWSDLGSLITLGGYSGTLSTAHSSPIGGRQAFTGSSGGYIETAVDLGSYAGQQVYIRFRMASDDSVASTGWYVDDVSIEQTSPAWTAIGSSSAGAVSYSWAVPSSAGNDYCLRIKASASGYTDSAYATSSPFSVYLDSDGDGVDDAIDPDPNNVDSDYDGLVDGYGGIIPVAALPRGVDLDGDGYVDGELDYGLNPAFYNIGDVAPHANVNNALDTGDLVVLQQLVLGTLTPTPLEMLLGDINLDNSLDVPDLQLLAQALLGGTALDDVLDQAHEPVGTPPGAYAVASTQSLAQIFTAGRKGLLREVSVLICRGSNATEDLAVSIWSTDGSGAPLAKLATVNVAPASVPVAPNQDYVTVDVSGSGILIDTGDVLAISLESTAANNPPYDERYTWFSTDGNHYSGGKLFVNGSEYSQDDAYFKTYVTPTH